MLANLDAVLGDCGVTFADVAKTTVFVTDLGDFAAMNETYAEAFGDHKPARSTVQVAALPLGRQGRDRGVGVPSVEPLGRLAAWLVSCLILLTLVLVGPVLVMLGGAVWSGARRMAVERRRRSAGARASRSEPRAQRPTSARG